MGPSLDIIAVGFAAAYDYQVVNATIVDDAIDGSVDVSISSFAADSLIH